MSVTNHQYLSFRALQIAFIPIALHLGVALKSQYVFVVVDANPPSPHTHHPPPPHTHTPTHPHTYPPPPPPTHTHTHTTSITLLSLRWTMYLSLFIHLTIRTVNHGSELIVHTRSPLLALSVLIFTKMKIDWLTEPYLCKTNKTKKLYIHARPCNL